MVRNQTLLKSAAGNLTLKRPSYRFWPHQSRNGESKHHNLLVQLAEAPQRRVYYIAPEFSEVSELDLAYRDRRVVKYSAAFSPVEIGKITGRERHRMAFRRGESYGWFRSEPKQVTKHDLVHVLGDMLQSELGSTGTKLATWLESAENELKGILKRNFIAHAALFDHSSQSKTNSESDVFWRLGYLTRTFFGCELFLVARNSDSSATESDAAS